MRVVLPFVILLGLAACGSEPDAAAASEKKVTAAATTAADDSVAAVVQSPGRPAVLLRFALEGRPKAGSPGRVRLDLSGAPGPLLITLQSEALALDPHSASLTIAEGGKPVSQLVSFTPQAAGFSELVVRVQLSAEGEPEVRYAIPLLVEAAGT